MKVEIGMKRREFTMRVRALATPSDFTENEHLLEVIDNLHFEHFLNCLKMGSTIKPSFKALDILNELSKETALGSDDILQLLPKFRTLISVFDSPSQPSAQRFGTSLTNYQQSKSEAMATGWDDHEPAPIEYFHGLLHEYFHEYRRKTVGEELSVPMTGVDFHDIVIRAKIDTYKKYEKLDLGRVIPKSELL